MKDILDLIGRLFLASVFIYLAIDKSTDKTFTLKLMSEYGFTWKPEFLYHASIVALTIGATLVGIGYRVGIGTLLICVYWLPYTFAVYQFWKYDSENAYFDQIMFLKNISVMGGLMILSANGAGKYSIKRLLATTKVN
ncbi:MAG: DoxX family protein [Saprospiraceae bacterium]